MSALVLAAFAEGGFAISPSYDGGRVIGVRLSGSADMAAAAALERYFPDVHTEAVRLSAERVDVDLRQLDFMSSSCFKSFINWITSIEEMPEAERYHIHFVSNPALHWQRRSLQALRLLSATIMSIEA